MARGNFSHNSYQHPLNGVWRALKQRCLNENCIAFPNYGGRGILLFPAWLEFTPFLEWALTNGYKPGLTLDRISNEGRRAFQMHLADEKDLLRGGVPRRSARVGQDIVSAHQ